MIQCSINTDFNSFERVVYKAIVKVQHQNEGAEYTLYIGTRCPQDSVFSALRASIKPGYTLCISNPIPRCTCNKEVVSLDRACAEFSTLRFFNVTKHKVEKTVYVIETNEEEL